MSWKKKSSQELEEQNKTRINEFKQKVANNLVSMLESGVDVEWQKPWNGSFNHLPHNPASKHQYTGGNLTYLMLHMMAKGIDDPRFLTVKQAKEKYGEDVYVKKGERAEYLLRPSPFFVNLDGKSVSPKKTKKDVQDFLQDFDPSSSSLSTEVIDKINEINTKDELSFSDISFVAKAAFGYKERMSYQAYAVFNGGQFENMPDFKDEIEIEPRTWKDNFLIENFVQASQAKVENQPIDRACYNKSLDVIRLPFKEDFSSDDLAENEISGATKYYATLLHEWAHWTGHESREARDEILSQTTTDYALEELFAESSSVLLGSYLDLPINVKQHAAYLDNWRKVAKEEPEVIYSTVQKATKLVEIVNSFEECKQPKVPWFPPKEQWEHLSLELKKINEIDDLPHIFFNKNGHVDWDKVSVEANITNDFIENNIDYLNQDLLKNNKFIDNADIINDDIYLSPAI